MNYTRKKLFSIKWGLISSLIICFILPILITVLSFVFYFRQQIKSEAETLITTNLENATNMIANNMEQAMNLSLFASYDNTIKKAYNDFNNGGIFVDFYQAVNAFLIRQYRSNTLVKSTYIIFNEGVLERDFFYVTNTPTSTTNESVELFKNNDKEAVINAAREAGTYFDFELINDRLYLIRNMVDSKYTPFAVIAIELDKDIFFEPLNNFIWLENLSVSFDECAIPLAGDIDISLATSTQITEKEKNKYLATVNQNINNYNLKIALSTYTSPMAQKFAALNSGLILIAIISTPIIIFIISSFNKHINKPIDNMVKTSTKIKNGELGTTIQDLPLSKELNYLTNQFNDMSLSMKQQFEQSYQRQIALQEAQIKALQSQINPHFLNNTLEIINWEARINNDTKVSSMIEALSTMLSAAMAKGESGLVTLYKEMEFVNAYLYINEVRMGTRLHIKKNIPVEVMECKLPRLLLQPIVENAIQHGIEARKRGEISISGRKEENYVIIEIENDNVLSEKDIEKISAILNLSTPDNVNGQDSNIGIRNVNKRLALMCGHDSGLKIIKTPNNTTLAVIKIYQE